MMKKLYVALLLLVSVATMAQDKITKKDGSTISCIVTEVGIGEVKYHYPDKGKVIFTIDKGLIGKIEFSSGEVMTFEKKSMNNPALYADQHKRALKLNFLSPLAGSTEIVYEQSIKPGRSWEAALGIMGLGFDPGENNPLGAYAKFAYKFMRSPNFYAERMRYDHILKGAYVAPEIAIRYGEFDGYGSYFNSDRERLSNNGIALTLKFGKQWVFDDAFLIDWFFGFGYGYSESQGDAASYGFFAGDDEIPIAFTAGLRVGWTF